MARPKPQSSSRAHHRSRRHLRPHCSARVLVAVCAAGTTAIVSQDPPSPPPSPPQPPLMPPPSPLLPPSLAHKKHPPFSALPSRLPSLLGQWPPPPPSPPPASPNLLQERMHHLICGGDSDPPRESMLVRLLLSTHDESIKLLFHAPGAPSSAGSAASVGKDDDDDDDDDGDGDEDDDLYAIAPAASLSSSSSRIALAFSPTDSPCRAVSSSLHHGWRGGWKARWRGCDREWARLGRDLPDNYALIGAAGMLGGVCHDHLPHGHHHQIDGRCAHSLPMALTIVVAKLIGNVFTASTTYTPA